MSSEGRIYTKLGDDGSTGLLFGGRRSKADPLLDAVGSIDESVATLGLARASSTSAELSGAILDVQRELFVAAADLVANPHARDRLVPGISLVTADMIARVEALIDDLVTASPLRPVFVVPGANLASASLDMARTQVRRAERRMVAWRAQASATTTASATTAATVNPLVGTYLNRVSDLLYVLARHAAADTEEPASHGATAG
jgi:cob(I)alamin adenosyltransferase